MEERTKKITRKETWRDVPNYPQYQVSDLGRVKSKKRTNRSIEKILKQQKHNKGYLMVSLYKNGKANQVLVHQLVAQAFHGHKPCGFGIVVNHINEIKTDNRCANLELVDTRKNITKSRLNKESSSRYTGVTKFKNGWVARMYLNGKQEHLGYFKKELDAHDAYQKALKDYNHILHSFNQIPDYNFKIAV